MNMDSSPEVSNRQNGPRSAVVEPTSVETPPRVVSDSSALAATSDNATQEISVYYAIVTTGKRYVYE